MPIEPGNQAAKDGFRAAHTVPSKLEIEILYGSNDEDTGLRQVELGSWLDRRTRVWFRYDDSLSLDAPDLASGDAENLLLGLFREFDGGWLGKIELGRRDLPQGEDQDLVGLEVTRLLTNRRFKLGMQRAPHSDGYTDRLLYGSFGFALGTDWFIEPTLYLSEASALEDEGRRLVTRFTYQSDALWGIELGLGFGETKSTLAEFDGDVTTASINWFMPLSPQYRLSLLVVEEETPSDDNTSVILGLTWRMQKG